MKSQVANVEFNLVRKIVGKLPEADMETLD
jgi:hypothetical protein